MQYSNSPSTGGPRFHRLLFRTALIGLAFSFPALANPESTGGESRLQVSRGFQARDLFQFDPSVFIGGLLVLPGGEVVLYNGTSVLFYQQDGSPPHVLFIPEDPPVFGNFLRLGPDGNSVYFGENHIATSESPHDIFRISLDLESPQVERIDSIQFNFDLAFDEKGRGFVSAFSDIENRIFLLDGDPDLPSDPVVVGIPGISGPVAYRGGKLYYSTAILEPNKNMIVYFTSEQLESGMGEGKEIDFQVALDEGQVIAEGLNIYFNLLFIGDRLFGTGGTGIDRIRTDGTVESFATIQVEGDRYASATFLAFQPGIKEFGSGVGTDGGSLYTIISDYNEFNNIVLVTPQLFFRRGNIHDDGELDLTDIIDLLGYLFLGKPGPDPLIAGDVNDDNEINICDPIYLLFYLFQGDPVPPEPFEEEGPDPTP